MCFLIHFVLNNVYVPFEAANIMFLSFIRVWKTVSLSLSHWYPGSGMVLAGVLDCIDS